MITESPVYALNNVWVTHTQENQTSVKVNFHIRYPTNSLAVFFDRLKPAFIWWGCEHGYRYMQTFTKADLVFDTDAGYRTTTTGIVLFNTYDWEFNWSILKDDFKEQIDDMFWMFSHEQYSSLHLIGTCHPPRLSTPPLLADSTSDDLEVLAFQPLTQSSNNI